MLGDLRDRLRMDNEPKESIDPRARKVWMIGGALGSIIVMAIALGFYAFVTTVYDAPDWVGWTAIALALVYVPWGVYFHPWLRMRFWRYELRENELEIQHGIFVIKRHLIPMVRVQYVDTEHGPLMRYFGLTTLSISTAATKFAIPALPKQRAEELRGEIATLARVSEEDV
jgi:membrane protein YdbS with pleckstrin-like domain